MGVIHYAYAFDYRRLKPAIFGDQNLKRDAGLERWREVAKQTIVDCSELGKDFLRAICFDEEEWADHTVDDIQKIDRYSEILIASSILTIHKLSRASFALLERVLPVLGWQSDEVRMLLLGRQFRHLIDSLEWFGNLSHVFRRTRSPSWLPVNDAKGLNKRFANLRAAFLKPDLKTLEMGKQALLALHLDDVSESELMTAAFLEMEKRLSMSIEYHHDLILVNDITGYTKKLSDPI